MMIDFVQLAQCLSPFLPALTEMSKEAGKAFGEDAFKAAKALWDRLHSQGDPEVIASAQSLAKVQQSVVNASASLEDLAQAQLAFSEALLQFFRREGSMDSWEPEVTQFIEISGEADDVRQTSKRDVSVSQKLVVNADARVKNVSQES